MQKPHSFFYKYWISLSIFATIISASFLIPNFMKYKENFLKKREAFAQKESKFIEQYLQNPNKFIANFIKIDNCILTINMTTYNGKLFKVYNDHLTINLSNAYNLSLDSFFTPRGSYKGISLNKSKIYLNQSESLISYTYENQGIILKPLYDFLSQQMSSCRIKP